MVSGLAEGDLPTSRKKPELQTTRVSYERVLPATRARERQLRQVLDSERGERLDDDAFLAAVFELALGAVTGIVESGVGDRAKYQVVSYVCDACRAGTQLAAGRQFAVDEAEVERAECDAERISALAPGRATQDIPKKVRRFVDARDRKRCRIPGCRSANCLELHHIVHREDGGSHEPENLIVMCDGHHKAHHRGVLWIGGTSSNLVVQRADEPGCAHVGAVEALAPLPADQVAVAAPMQRSSREGAGKALSAGAGAGDTGTDTYEVAAPAPAARPAHVIARHVTALRNNKATGQPNKPPAARRDVIGETPKDLACCALRTMGWKPRIAAAAVEVALAELGPAVALDPLIRTALQRCR